jgi:hypothetical protein
MTSLRSFAAPLLEVGCELSEGRDEDVAGGFGLAPIVPGDIKTPPVPRIRHSGSAHFHEKVVTLEPDDTVVGLGRLKDPGGEHAAKVGSDHEGRSFGNRACVHSRPIHQRCNKANQK